jgi:hypothetical protein
VVILSREFVRKKYPMQELRILLQRWQAQGVELVPVLYGISVEDLLHMRQLYSNEPWCVAEAMPAGSVLDGWAEDLQQLSLCTMIRSDQVRRCSCAPPSAVALPRSLFTDASLRHAYVPPQTTQCFPSGTGARQYTAAHRAARPYMPIHSSKHVRTSMNVECTLLLYTLLPSRSSTQLYTVRGVVIVDVSRWRLLCCTIT